MKFENFTLPVKKNEEGVLDKIKDVVNKTAWESGIPNLDFKSTLGVYGGKINVEPDGKMVWNNTGIISTLDRIGDAVLRTYDDHVVGDLWALLRRHPKAFLNFLAPGPKRHRGNREEIFENIKRLGLEDTYGLHEKGIEIKNKDLYLHGISLQDVLRTDIIDSDKIKGLDRFQALAESGKYLKKIHDGHGGVGEMVSGDIIFKTYENGQVSEPILNMPDIVFNEDKNISEKEKKATDILEFLMNIGTEEFRRTEAESGQGDFNSIRVAMKTVLENYNDKSVINLVKSYIKRGRLTLQGDVKLMEDKGVKNDCKINLPKDTFTTRNRGLFTKHNEPKFIIQSRDMEASLKEITFEVCDEVGSSNAENL